MCQLFVNDVLKTSHSDLLREFIMCRFIFVPFCSFEQIQKQTMSRKEDKVHQEDEEQHSG